MQIAMSVTFIVPEGTTPEQLHELLCLAMYEGVTSGLVSDVISDGPEKEEQIAASLAV